MVKIKVDVERLLAWAFREELPKGYRDSMGTGIGSSSSVSPMFRLAGLGTTIDESMREPGFPEALGAPHPDAFMIESAVNNLPDVGMDWRNSRESIMGHLAPYAPLDHPALVNLNFELAGLVATHARMGSRPIWDLGPVSLHRVTGKNGKPVVQFLEDGKLVNGLTAGRRYGEGARCPLELDPLGPEIAFARGEYAAWRSGLERVRDSLLRFGLHGHIVTGPIAAAEPWITGPEHKGRIFRSP